jgi:hypothetical protein
LSAFLVSLPVHAAVVTVDVTTKAVNPQARGITVVYRTELGEKTIELDVSRKAEITVNGKEGTLDSLGPGLKAKVSYDRELAIVTKIAATGTASERKSPELVEASELSPGWYPWVSEDGLTVYWERERTIWTASRKDAQSYFESQKPLFKGRCPTISSDGLEMVFLWERTLNDGEVSLYVTTREAADIPWKRAVEIPELHDAKFPAYPCLSDDGLTLYFSSRLFHIKSKEARGGWWKGELMYTTRKNRNSPWSPPKPLPVSRHTDGCITYPHVVSGGLTMFCVNCREAPGGFVGQLMQYSRASVNEPFVQGKLIDLKNLPQLSVATPRYIAATNELFVTRRPLPQDPVKTMGIWIIRNFVSPIDIRGSRTLRE